MPTTLLINPGSHIADDPDDEWTNTYQQALTTAREWLTRIHSDGITDVELIAPHPTQAPHDGRWTFTFRHTITGTEVTLETHGIHPLEVYERRHIFGARIYWNGSSSADPELENFAAPGFRAVRTYTPAVTA
jgi:hypothetical protein